VKENQKEQDAVDGCGVRSESKKPHATRVGRRGTVSITRHLHEVRKPIVGEEE
jgi:hypothetical protein